MDIVSYLLGTKKAGGGGGGGSSDLDWKSLGYQERPQTITNAYNYANYIKDNWTDNTSNLSNFKEVMIAPMISFGNRTTLNSFAGYCYSLVEVPLWDTSNITDMTNMFNNCSALKYVPLFNTSNVTTMYNTFSNCRVLKEVPLFNTVNVTSMRNMFSACEELTTISVFNTSKVTTMQNMVSNCPKLTDESLNNILKMCIGTTSAYTRAKTLRELGIASYQYADAKIEGLPDYQNFLDAGWTIS